MAQAAMPASSRARPAQPALPAALARPTPPTPNVLVRSGFLSLPQLLDLERRHAQHPAALLAQRRSAREQHPLVQFLAISPRAQAYREELEATRVDARAHLRRIVALVEMHGHQDMTCDCRHAPYCLLLRLTTSASQFPDFAAQWLARRFPLSTLRPTPHDE